MISPQWLAGFFDGEGCISISVTGKIRQVTMRITIVNTDEDVLKAIQAEYGGYLLKPKTHKAGWKPTRGIIWQGSYAWEFLDRIKDHVILKKRQVELALQFGEFMHRPKTERCIVIRQPAPHCPNRTYMKRSPETIEKELWFKNQMHVLNRKGTERCHSVK